MTGSKHQRRGISKKTRFEVFKRDAFTCQYCGTHPPGVLLHIDHILAVSAGGTNDIDNLVTACEPCNLGKGARNLKVAPQSLADKAKEISEREAQLLGYQDVIEGKRQRLDQETWRVLEEIHGAGVESVSKDEYRGTMRFIEKLGLHVVLEAAETAAASPRVSRGNKFRYFCGVCWGKIREQG